MSSSSLCLSQDTPDISLEAKRALKRYAQVIVWGDVESHRHDSYDYRDILGRQLNNLGVPAEEIKREIREEFQRKETLHTNARALYYLPEHSRHGKSPIIPETKGKILRLFEKIFLYK